MVTLILLNFLKSLYKLRLLLDNINIYNYFKQRGTAMRPQPPEEKRRKNSLKENIERSCWDGQWYLRAFFDDGTRLGSHTSEECQIDSLSQSFGTGRPVKIFYMIGRSRPENSRHPAPCSRVLPPEKTKHPAEPAGKTLQI